MRSLLNDCSSCKAVKLRVHSPLFLFYSNGADGAVAVRFDDFPAKVWKGIIGMVQPPKFDESANSQPEPTGIDPRLSGEKRFPRPKSKLNGQSLMSSRLDPAKGKRRFQLRSLEDSKFKVRGNGNLSAAWWSGIRHGVPREPCYSFYKSGELLQFNPRKRALSHPHEARWPLPPLMQSSLERHQISSPCLLSFPCGATTDTVIASPPKRPLPRRQTVLRDIYP